MDWYLKTKNEEEIVCKLSCLARHTSYMQTCPKYKLFLNPFSERIILKPEIHRKVMIVLRFKGYHCESEMPLFIVGLRN